MSSIRKLSIQGIRSFDSSGRQIIEFGFPLTLIVGQNGSGKTTIIECLKYGTTGELPPNSKGGAFIHDPKISNENEVKAQIKIGFQSSNGAEMICTRSMQLTIKKNGARTFKTLEGQLVTNHNGERSTVSSKCAELDSQIPYSLGVSKSILEYVVFCHQEDSLWPLSEPAALKRRFDDIFEAVKYSKALDSIKVLRKETAGEIRYQQQTVNNLQTEVERATKTKSRADQLSTDLERYNADLQVLMQEIEAVTKESDRLFKSNQEFQKVLARIDHLRSKRKLLLEQSKRLATGIDELTESTEHMQQRLSTLETSSQTREADKTAFEQRAKNVALRIDAHRGESKELDRLEGQLKAQIDAYESKLTSRNDLVRTVMSQYSTEPPSDVSLSDAYRILSSLEEQYSSALDEVRKKNRLSESEINDLIQDLSNRQYRLEQIKSDARESVRSAEAKEIPEATKRLKDIKVDDQAQEYQRILVQDMETKFNSMKSDFENRQWAKELRDINNELRDVEDEVDSLNEKMTAGNKQADHRARLGILQDDLRRRKLVLDKTKQSHIPKIEALLELDKNRMVNLNEVYDAALEDVRNSMSDSERQNRELSLRRSELQTEVNILNDRITAQEGNISSGKSIIERTLGPNYQDQIGPNGNDYESALHDAIDSLSEITISGEQRRFVVAYHENAMRLAETQHKCVLCLREFANGEQEIRSFQTMLREKNANIPVSEESLKEQISETQKEVDNLRRVGPHLAQMTDLTKKVDEAKVRIADLTIDLEKIDEDLSRLEEDVRQPQRERLAKLESIEKYITDIIRGEKEIDDVQKQLDDCRNLLEDSSGAVGAGIMSLNDIQKRLTELGDKSKNLRKQSQRINDEKDEGRLEIQSFANSLQDKRAEVSKYESDIREKSNLEEILSDLHSKVRRCKEQVNEAEKELKVIALDITSKRSELEKSRQTGLEAESAAIEQLNNVKGASRQLRAIDKEIEVLAVADYYGKLEECQSNIGQREAEIAELEGEQSEVNNELSEWERRAMDMRVEIRNLQDNLELRHHRDEIKEVEEELKGLKRKNAEMDSSRYEVESNRLQVKLNNLTRQHASKLGEVKQMEDRLAQLNDELNTEYANVHSNHQRALVRLNATTAANEDMAKYSKALDSAIMRYHSLKMQEINRIIDELWKRTYTGTDVDTILIRSDSNEESTKTSSTTASKAGNRSYNYRVCMVKQNVELDMRGRCSTGQKVLACIIIRLALAECFGVNCGLIALDEPTTNLDRDNSEALAKSLGSIIATRQSQKNFQLIVITHDESFLEWMDAANYTDHFFRVTRNEDQKSQIIREPISNIVS